MGWEVRPKGGTSEELFGHTEMWTAVVLPHDAVITMERRAGGSDHTAHFPPGAWAYRKLWTLPDALRGKGVVLEFEGVFRHALVKVNGQFAANRPYGYSNFYVRIDHLLRFGGENLIEVEARASGDDTRWYTGGGIYRNVKLLVAGPIHVALDGVTVKVRALEEDRAILEVVTVIDNDGLSTVCTSVQTKLLDRNGTVVAADAAPVTLFPSSSETLRQRVVVNTPLLWSCESPELYTCKTTVGGEGEELDRETTTFGIRTLEVDSEEGLRVNGELVKLRGACVHHDNGIIGAATIDRAEERRVELLKAAGFNAIRSAHNPASKALLDACDRVGLYVMDELTDVWTSPKAEDDYSNDFPQWWEADLQAMVAKDRNHPSVILYSLGNEIPEVGTPVGASLSRKMAERIRDVDDSRLITNAVNPIVALRDEFLSRMSDMSSKASPGEPTQPTARTKGGLVGAMPLLLTYAQAVLQEDFVGERTDETFATLDVAGYNYLAARYEIDHLRSPNRVIVGSEVSAWRVSKLWPQVQESDHIIGDFIWTGWDYMGEVGHAGLSGFPSLTSQSGDLDITGHRKPISYYREIVYGLRTDPYIVVVPGGGEANADPRRQEWHCGLPSWTQSSSEEQPVHVWVFSIADEVELFVNGVSHGCQPTGRQREFQARFDVQFTPDEVAAVARNGGTEVGRHRVVSAGQPVELQLRADRQEIGAGEGALAFVEIELVDAAGTLVPDSNVVVTVEVVGSGVLQGLGSANPASTEGFCGPSHDLYQGRALAAVRPIGPGEMTVRVSAQGFEPQSAKIQMLDPALQ